MKVHVIQHVPFEELGYIKDYLIKIKAEVTISEVWITNSFPPPLSIDLLLIMGSPSSVNDNNEWLAREKQFVTDCIKQNKKILGICFGAQLIASVLGAEIYPNTFTEIGWFEVNIKTTFCNWLQSNVPENLSVFHWHGETFNLPQGAINHASSAACQLQLFTYGENIIGIQFHLEADQSSIKAMVDHEGEELIHDTFIQSGNVILQGASYISESNNLMEAILNKLCV